MTHLDPVTLHGTHYTLEDFDAEVAKRIDAWIQDSNEDLTQEDIDNIRLNFRRSVYKDWTGADSDMVTQWEMANSLEHYGFAVSGFAKEDSSNSLTQPIHGVSLEDYAGAVYKISQGFSEEDVAKALGIDGVLFAEVNTMWTQRMEEDGTFTVTTLFGQYFGTAPQNQKFNSLSTNNNSASNENLEKLKTDRYFYEELCGARIAAYEYGIDGAQWILDNFGIGLGDFQAVAMEYGSEQNQKWSSQEVVNFASYQNEKQKEYAEYFAAQQGGNVADDIEF